MSECLWETTQIPTPIGNHPLLSDIRVHVKFDSLILDFCDLPRMCNVTAGGKTRENNLIADEKDQRKKGNPELWTLNL